MKKVLILFILFIPLVVLGYNETINPLCTNKEKDKLMKSVLDFSYALEKYKEVDSIFYKVTIYNMNNDIVIDYDKKTYTVSNNVINHIVPGTKVLLKIYANPSGICEGYNITTKVIVIPYYNKYKDNSLCVGNEEYYLCKENVNTNISEKEFNRQIAAYIKSNTIKEDTESEIPEKLKVSDYDKAIYFIRQNYAYILFGVIVLGTIGIAFLKIKKHNSGDLL